MKDTKRTLKELTDIVRGEHTGSITYRRSDLITSTKTHEDRLKFLSAWLAKNQRRLGTYGQETFEATKKLLNSYLSQRDYREVFAKHRELHHEVVHRLAYLNQVLQLQPLEKLAQPGKRQPGLGPSRRLALAVAFLEENQASVALFLSRPVPKMLPSLRPDPALSLLQEIAGQREPPGQFLPAPGLGDAGAGTGTRGGDAEAARLDRRGSKPGDPVPDSSP